MAMNYKHIVRDLNPRASKGGYKNVIWTAPVSDFLSIAKPPYPAPLHGDRVTITGDHTFTDPKGFFSWDSKTDSVTGTVASTGDKGTKLPQYTYKFVIVGDSASTQESMENALNDHMIWLFKDANCLVDDAYVQLGDDCDVPEVTIEGDFKTTKDGLKEWTVTVVSTARYFYTGTVTESTETDA